MDFDQDWEQMYREHIVDADDEIVVNDHTLKLCTTRPKF